VIKLFSVQLHSSRSRQMRESYVMILVGHVVITQMLHLQLDGSEASDCN
jgi:hypothetical protein